MKKRIATLILAVVMLTSLLVAPAEAAAVKFSDVKDSHTASAVETLRIMGVIDGYPDGSFVPEGVLTRAQFCKMVISAMDGTKELGKYTTMTIFPDVTPSHWAAAYVNMAAKQGMIAGYPNGSFGPNDTVTAGQAITILLRLLGYKDADLGGIWPESQMAMAKTIGLTDAVGVTGGRAALTRGQAAKLFANLLQTDMAGGGTLFALSETVTLTAVDGGRGTMTAGGTTYDMVKPVASTSLTGSRGRVVLDANGKKALTFLTVDNRSKGVSNAAVIIYADRDASGLSALAGSNDYCIYKNGLPATVADLRKNDVAIYSAATNSILVCDTRVTVYYEDCRPSPAAPTTVYALGNTEFSVLPTAVESVAKFKPGQIVTLLLTADGQIAGIVEPNRNADSNAMGIVDEKGAVHMFCGTGTIALNLKNADGEDMPVNVENYGYVVRISSDTKKRVNLSAQKRGVNGDLDILKKVLDDIPLAENVRIYRAGEATLLSELDTQTVKKENISCVRKNWRGEIDLICITDRKGGITYYGRADVTTGTQDDDVFGAYDVRMLRVITGTNEATEFYETGYSVKNGNYVAATLRNGYFAYVEVLTKLGSVSERSWIGKSAVTYGGRTYTVAEGTMCYNVNTGRWLSLDEALAYSSTLNLYVQDQVVRVIEIKE